MAYLYAIATVIFMFIWPVFLSNQSLVVVAVNVFVSLLVWHYNNHRDISFFQGLVVISASMMSGCANITMLYLPFVMAFVYFSAVINTLAGLSNGKEHSHNQWAKLVKRFYDNRIRR